VLDRISVLKDETPVSAFSDGGGRLHIALLFPAEYHIGMANLAVHALYRQLNSIDEVSCERVFFPPLEGDANGPLISLETGTPLGGFDAVAVSSSYELDWLRLPAALVAGGVPALAAERGERAPVVLAGGPAITSNPEPLAEIADALFIGEAEEALPALTEALGQEDREDVLDALAEVPSVYVPTRPPDEPVRRALVEDLDAFPTHSEILTPHSEFANVFLIETGRGCPRSCSFCLARQIYHPARARSLNTLLPQIELGLSLTDRIGLVGAAVADHPRVVELASAVADRGGRVSLSSLRIERVTPELLAPLVAGGQRSITLAPEAASPDVAETLGKTIEPEAMAAALAAAEGAGIRAVKLYYIVGVPGETDEQAVDIARQVAGLERDFPRLRFTVSVSPLTPKPHTELARAGVPDPKVVRKRLRAIGAALRHDTRAKPRLGSARWAAVQTILSRGGRELTGLLLEGNDAGAGELLSSLAGRGLAMDDYLGPQASE